MNCTAWLPLDPNTFCINMRMSSIISSLLAFSMLRRRLLPVARQFTYTMQLIWSIYLQIFLHHILEEHGLTVPTISVKWTNYMWVNKIIFMNFLNQFKTTQALREVPNRRIEFKDSYRFLRTCPVGACTVAPKDRAHWRVFISCHAIDSIYFDRCIVIVHMHAQRTAS